MSETRSAAHAARKWTAMFRKRYLVRRGAKVRLDDHDPDDTAGWEKEAARQALLENRERLAALQGMLWAERKHALLIVLQGMDTSGKDGTIRNVMHGVNPQGCRVTPFRAPSEEELLHDFLWRVHKVVPARGEIGIFNRSHYEDVVAARVRGLVPARVWRARYEQINVFERLLADNAVVIVKFFLHISNDEQRQRLEKRLRDPAKNWKLSPGDLEDRARWPDYVRAYQDALSRCSPAHAPWFVVPADKKWFRDLVVSSILVETLEGLRLRWPAPVMDLRGVVVR